MPSYYIPRLEVANDEVRAEMPHLVIFDDLPEELKLSEELLKEASKETPGGASEKKPEEMSAVKSGEISKTKSEEMPTKEPEEKSEKQLEKRSKLATKFNIQMALPGTDSEKKYEEVPMKESQEEPKQQVEKRSKLATKFNIQMTLPGTVPEKTSEEVATKESEEEPKKSKLGMRLKINLELPKDPFAGHPSPLAYLKQALATFEIASTEKEPRPRPLVHMTLMAFFNKHVNTRKLVVYTNEQCNENLGSPIVFKKIYLLKMPYIVDFRIITMLASAFFIHEYIAPKICPVIYLQLEGGFNSYRDMMNDFIRGEGPFRAFADSIDHKDRMRAGRLLVLAMVALRLKLYLQTGSCKNNLFQCKCGPFKIPESAWRESAKFEEEARKQQGLM